MKVLICASPGLGHFLPMVPLAWAARAGGHEILVVATGPALEAACGAGLNAVDAAQDRDIAHIFRTYMAGIAQNPPADPLTSTIDLFAQISDAMTEGTLDAARTWQPDVIVSSPLQGAGPLAAALHDVPVVHHGLGWGFSAADVRRLQEGMRDAYDRHAAPAATPPEAVVDLCPPSMRAADALPGHLVRYVPYGGGGMLPDWLIELPKRPRVCLTLGSVLPRVSGIQGMRSSLEAVADLPVDAVLALGAAVGRDLGALPANVTPVGWVPMDILLPTCAAVVHHGGSGTCFNALVAGVPQLAVPHAGDQFVTAAAISSRGVGLVSDPGSGDVAAIRSLLQQLLEGEGPRAAAADVRAEIAAMPPPVDAVGWLTALAS